MHVNVKPHTTMEITAIYYLIPSLIMFCAGIYGFITRKNMIAILISLELMLNAFVGYEFDAETRRNHRERLDAPLLPFLGVVVRLFECA